MDGKCTERENSYYILPNEEIAAEWIDTVSGHLEFMQEKSYRDGPLKLIQYFVSSGPEW